MSLMERTYNLGGGLTFMPLSKHPTGVLLGEFYLHGELIGKGHMIIRGDEYDALMGAA